MANLQARSDQARPLLVVAHPGHELRLYGWCALAQPDLFILTKGARGQDRSDRVDASRRLAASFCMTTVEPLGALRDRDAYQLILDGRAQPFLATIEDLANLICERGYSEIVTDAWQGYNPSHDVIHIMARCAAARAGARLERSIPVFDYPVLPKALAPNEPLGPHYHTVALDASQLRKKLAAMEAYPEVESEREELLALECAAELASEPLHTPRSVASILSANSTPVYELYGQARVASGVYQHVLRRHHVIAIVRELICAHADILDAAA